MIRNSKSNNHSKNTPRQQYQQNPSNPDFYQHSNNPNNRQHNNINNDNNDNINIDSPRSNSSLYYPGNVPDQQIPHSNSFNNQSSNFNDSLFQNNNTPPISSNTSNIINNPITQNIPSDMNTSFQNVNMNQNINQLNNLIPTFNYIPPQHSYYSSNNMSSSSSNQHNQNTLPNENSNNHNVNYNQNMPLLPMNNIPPIPVINFNQLNFELMQMNNLIAISKQNDQLQNDIGELYNGSILGHTISVIGLLSGQNRIWLRDFTQRISFNISTYFMLSDSSIDSTQNQLFQYGTFLNYKKKNKQAYFLKNTKELFQAFSLLDTSKSYFANYGEHINKSFKEIVNIFERFFSKDGEILIEEGLPFYNKNMFDLILYLCWPIDDYREIDDRVNKLKIYKYFSYLHLEIQSLDISPNKHMTVKNFWRGLPSLMKKINKDYVKDFINPEYKNLLKIFTRSYLSEISCSIQAIKNSPPLIKIDFFYKIFKDHIYDKCTKKAVLKDYGFLFMLFYQRYMSKSSIRYINLRNDSTINKVHRTIRILKKIGVSKFDENINIFYKKIGFNFFEKGINRINLNDLFYFLFDLKEENLIDYNELRRYINTFILCISNERQEPPYMKSIKIKFENDFYFDNNFHLVSLIENIEKYYTYSCDYVKRAYQAIKKTTNKSYLFPDHLVLVLMEYIENIRYGEYHPFELGTYYDYANKELFIPQSRTNYDYQFHNEKLWLAFKNHNAFRNFPMHLRYLLYRGYQNKDYGKESQQLNKQENHKYIQEFMKDKSKKSGFEYSIREFLNSKT